ncbi:MAG: CLPTM1 family protein [Bacteroidia bacterium]|nr:CLPTM1 family protein [Bacteroidia bacterium]
MQTLEKISLIKLKIQTLLKQQESLKMQLLEAEKEIDSLKEIISDQTKRIEILEDKNKISKLADGIQLGKRDNKELKLAINSYIREIDECLKLLNHYSNNQ